MRIDKRWLIVITLAPRAYAQCERPDATHLVLTGFPCYRIESTRAAPMLPTRSVYYDFRGNVAKVYVCGSLTVTLDPRAMYSVAWYGSDAFDAPCLGSCIVAGPVADTNLDAGVTLDDLLLFNRWFDAGDPRADVDDGSGTGTHDGGVGIDDLLYYLKCFDNGGNVR